MKLYLDIEKMRFEDRLRPHFNIDAAVEQARLPSLLLQPLVENAIKYAVSPQEDGADITVAAQLAGSKRPDHRVGHGSGIVSRADSPHFAGDDRIRPASALPTFATGLHRPMANAAASMCVQPALRAVFWS